LWYFRYLEVLWSTYFRKTKTIIAVNLLPNNLALAFYHSKLHFGVQQLERPHKALQKRGLLVKMNLFFKWFTKFIVLPAQCNIEFLVEREDSQWSMIHQLLEAAGFGDNLSSLQKYTNLSLGQKLLLLPKQDIASLISVKILRNVAVNAFLCYYHFDLNRIFWQQHALFDTFTFF